MEDKMSFADLLVEKVTTADKKKYPFRNLCFEGGGILGLAYSSALEELHKLGYLGGIKNFAGSSAGSIIAGALACGASFNFIADELKKADFASFMDYGNKLKAAYNLLCYHGICPGTAFESWYAGIIEKLTGNPDITLKQIHDKFGGRLVITATSMNTRRVEFFDYRTHPDLPLRKAVRMSMSIPFIFMPVEYAGDVWVDGGVLDNFPIRAFHRETANSDRINPKTLGLMLMTADEETAAYPKVTGFWSYVDALLGCYMTQTQKMYMDPQDWARTVKINCGDVSSFNFYIDDKSKEALLEAGRKAVIDHFKLRVNASQNAYYVSSGPKKTGHRAADEVIIDIQPEEKNSADI